MAEYTQGKITEDLTKLNFCKMLHFEMASDISKEGCNTIEREDNCRQVDNICFCLRSENRK